MAGGPAEFEFDRVTRVHSAQALTLIVVVVESAALLVTPTGRIAAAVAALVAMTVWRAVALVRLRADAAPWVLGVDVVVLSAAGLLQPVLDVPTLVRDNCGWVFLAVEAAAVAHQWQFARRPAAVATVVTATTYLAGALVMGELSVPAALVSAAWVMATGVVSRWVRESLRAAVRRADEESAAHEQAQQEIEVATALRDAELEHLAKLHDTVAATLMMVGLGAAGPELPEQAARDLAVLTAPPRPAPAAREEVVDRLTEVIRSSGLRVAFTREGPRVDVPGSVIEALSGAVGESLRNVVRHAGVDHAEVELDSSGGPVLVRVRDGGRGFAGGVRWGRGIRYSIIERMARVGGGAGVTASAQGVLVELRWPAGPER